MLHQGASHVKPTPKVRRAINFHTPGIFREREAAKKSEYSESAECEKLSVLAQIHDFLYRKYMYILSKETDERLRTTSHSHQERQISNSITPRTDFIEEMMPLCQQ